MSLGKKQKQPDNQLIYRKESFWRSVFTSRYMLLMLLPAVVYVFIFSYLPMTGLVLAFKNFNYKLGIFGSPWCGLKNFRFLLISGKLWSLTRNTILYNLAFIISGIILQVFFAIIINELSCKWFKNVFQSFMFLPHFISWVVIVSVAQCLLSFEYGALNSMIVSLGGERLNIYTNAGIWPVLLVIFHAWKTTGYGSIVYLASVTGIDGQIYEAAEIDGANTWQRITRITLPNLVPTIIIMFLLAVGQIFRGDFGMFFQLVGNNGVILEKADILDLYIYRALAQTSQLGMASASGFYQSVLCFITILLANKIVKIIEPEYTLF